MLKTLAFDPTINLISWLQTQAQAYQCQWLLAHSLDCVIWGKFEQGELQLGCDKDKLNLETLQQCRIFGPTAEVLLWHSADGWRAVRIKEPTDAPAYIDEAQLLWGTKGEPATMSGFTSLTDGIQGMAHTLPLALSAEKHFSAKRTSQDPDHRPARLLVRHILDFDQRTGAAYIRASRLVDVFAKEVKRG